MPIKAVYGVALVLAGLFLIAGSRAAERDEQAQGCVEPDVLSAWIAEWPAEHRLVIDDQLVVLFTYPHPARFWSESASVYDRPSLSCVDLNWNGEIARRIDSSDEGRQRLDRALADDALMTRIRALIRGRRGPACRKKPVRLAADSR